jgi:hypothetical protein
MMILPGTEAGSLHVKRRVAGISSLNRKNMLTIAAMITRQANRNGITCLTLTA